MAQIDWEKKAEDILNKLKVSDSFDDSTVITFGKYKGKKLEEVPPEYLQWLLTDTDLVEKMKLYNYIAMCLPAILQQEHQQRRSKK